jgi:hypothetical protein
VRDNEGSSEESPRYLVRTMIRSLLRETRLKGNARATDSRRRKSADSQSRRLLCEEARPCLNANGCDSVGPAKQIRCQCTDSMGSLVSQSRLLVHSSKPMEADGQPPAFSPRVRNMTHIRLIAFERWIREAILFYFPDGELAGMINLRLFNTSSLYLLKKRERFILSHIPRYAMNFRSFSSIG